MRMLLAAIAVTIALAGAVRWYASTITMSARLTFDDAVFAQVPEDVIAALGGPLTPAEAATIMQVSRDEVGQAFSPLRIRFTDEGRAFWRVAVVPAVTPRAPNGRAMRNAAGAAYTFGMLGGAAFLSFNTLAIKAAVYAPPGVSRQELVQAIGRGLGRSAVHEFAHLVAGSMPIHSDDDGHYEYDSADRPSQYYGALSWGPAWPLLHSRLGPRDASGKTRGR